MEQFAKETLPVSLEAEMRHSYLDYAMSVIVGRALPDVRDGLKPVHRRVLFAMHEANIAWNRPYVKCARVVGEVMGKYHPHGDLAIYDTLVRMAQDFSLRYPLVDGQGNFGSIDGDNPAAMRYTECRLQKIAAEMLADLDRETVDFVPNYDGKEHEPAVLPSRLPNLLINGSSGIAVGMATNIPPHNLTETIAGCLALLGNPDISVEELMELIPAPDFPTAGIIYGLAGVREGYRTGRGRVVIRARTHIEDLERGGRQAIIVDEIPYQVNKSNLLSRIGDLVREKKLDGISDLRDESDRTGMRVVIELKRGEVPEIVLNNLYKLTQLQDSFGMNMVALVDGQPRLLDLKQFLEYFLIHRREVITRRTVFELRKARERGHVLEGLAVALSNVDEIIALIKASPTPPEAKVALMAKLWRSAVVEEMLKRAAADAARLVLTLLRTAALEYGATIANRVAACGVSKDAGGRVDGLMVSADGEEFTIRTHAVVNAAGVWSDDVRAMDEGHHPDSIRPAKGIHITVPWHKVRNTVAAVIPVPKDRRSVFVVPQGEFTYIGTTDTDYDGPVDDPQCTREDIDYLLSAINGASTEQLTVDDINTWGVVQ